MTKPIQLCRQAFYRKGEVSTHTCHRVVGHEGWHREDANLARAHTRAGRARAAAALSIHLEDIE